MELNLTEQELEMLIQAEGWFLEGARHKRIIPILDKIDEDAHKALLGKLKEFKTALDK